jgi:mRNA interferase MazF
MIQQGDIYWIDLGQPIGSEPGYIRPYVVIQNDVLNRSQIRTVIVCALTTNLRRARAPGNVLLEPDEADLPEQSVVNVSQVFTVDKALLNDKIGSLSRQRIQEVLAGLMLLITSEEANLSDEENRN